VLANGSFVPTLLHGIYEIAAGSQVVELLSPVGNQTVIQTKEERSLRLDGIDLNQCVILIHPCSAKNKYRSRTMQLTPQREL